MRMVEIILNIRVLSIQLAGCRIDVVSTFRNRQRNDASCWRCHLLDHFLRIIRSEQKIDNRTYDARSVAFHASLNEGVKTILREHDVA